MIRLPRDMMDVAQAYANIYSGCQKVKVGALIVKGNRIIGIGANRSIPDLCDVCGCLRKEKYGDDAKSHRGPTDCRAVHSEIDAIANSTESCEGATMYITRYPCESCARAIVAAGIDTVYFGRDQQVSNETTEIFAFHDVQIFKVGWAYEDVTS